MRKEAQAVTFTYEVHTLVTPSQSKGNGNSAQPRLSLHAVLTHTAGRAQKTRHGSFQAV